MSSISRFLQDNFCGKKSWKSIKYSQSYDTVCQLALLGVKGLSLNEPCVVVVSVPVTSPEEGLEMELDALTEKDLIFICCLCINA